MAEICRNENIDRIVFDCELTATQIRNIEDVCGVFTIDRTMLILDIFAQRATTREGRLQVEIAQNKYRLPSLQAWELICHVLAVVSAQEVLVSRSLKLTSDTSEHVLRHFQTSLRR